ncbi:hypothetical protein GCM10023222_13980 [Saccharopolyspora cebuensis]
MLSHHGFAAEDQDRRPEATAPPTRGGSTMDETAYTAPELAEIGDFATETLGGGGYIFDVLYVIRW